MAADVTPRVGADTLIIQSYAPQGFRISGADYAGAVLIAGGKVHPVDAKASSQLEHRHFSVLKGMDVRYLIIGCGAKMQLPPPAVLQDIRDLGIVAEAMTTSAACRTYNVLVAEGRQIAALLIPE